MKKTLGLDLGSNSLGWAVLDDITGDFLNKGVVVFPEGVTEKDDLKTPAAMRKLARYMGKFRRMSDEFKRQIMSMDVSELSGERTGSGDANRDDVTP